MIFIAKLPFQAADILLPKTNHGTWAVVACDQFTSEPEYWAKADELVGNVPSALRITLPEIYLEGDYSHRIEDINRTMREYLNDDLFTEYRDAMFYIERTLPDGSIRHGIIGAVDLEEYDFRPEKKALIRATEGTVLDRIPPRVKIRQNAPLELPHVMLLIDDPGRTVIEPLKGQPAAPVYDFALMLGGGHLKGYVLDKSQQERILAALGGLIEGAKDPLLFAVGDGNHSLATAKACYEQNPTQLSRYALVEVVNIHDSALVFEPIYRILFGVDPAELYRGVKAAIGTENGSTPVEFLSADVNDTILTDGFPVGMLQNYLDEYVKTHPGAKIDYIHGQDVVKKLAMGKNCAGFLFSGMEKNELFPIVLRDGTLPRKSFSMGEAAGKRYYMECRKIK